MLFNNKNLPNMFELHKLHILSPFSLISWKNVGERQPDPEAITATPHLFHHCQNIKNSVKNKILIIKSSDLGKFTVQPRSDKIKTTKVQMQIKNHPQLSSLLMMSLTAACGAKCYTIHMKSFPRYL